MSSVPRLEPAPLVSVRESRLHGLGVFALRRRALPRHHAAAARSPGLPGATGAPVVIQQPASIHACT